MFKCNVLLIFGFISYILFGLFLAFVGIGGVNMIFNWLHPKIGPLAFVPVLCFAVMFIIFASFVVEQTFSWFKKKVPEKLLRN